MQGGVPHSLSPELNLDIEIECSVTVKMQESMEDSLKALQKAMINSLSSRLRGVVNDSFKYDKWSIVREDSLENPEYAGVQTIEAEIRSPTLFDGPDNEWTHAGDIIFKCLQSSNPDICTTGGPFALHFHISPREGTWQLMNLQQLSCAAIHFEQAFEMLYPEDEPSKGPRRGVDRKFAKANHAHNRKLLGRSRDDAIAMVNKTRRVEELVSLMNPPLNPHALNDRYHGWDETKPVYGLVPPMNPRPGPDMIHDRFFTWNFTNLLPGSTKHTVEYRFAPPLRNQNKCVLWAELIVAFVRAAMKLEDWTAEGLDHVYHRGTPGELHNFVKTDLPSGDESPFDALIGGKTGSLPVAPLIDEKR